jgi:hypothetical protein
VGEGYTGEPQANHERLTVAQAAAALGITEGAVRSRIKRGTLRTTKEGGTVFVLWGGGTSQANQSPHTGVPNDQSKLIASLQDQVSYLREQLDAEREARTEERRRHDTVLAQLSAANAEQARTIRAIEAPAETPPDERESPETAAEASDSAESGASTVEAPDELSAERARREMAETTLQEGMAEQRRRRVEAERERDELRREAVGFGRRTAAHEVAEGQQGRGQPRPATGGAQEEGARRPWWRRVFGR